MFILWRSAYAKCKSDGNPAECKQPLASENFFMQMRVKTNKGLDTANAEDLASGMDQGVDLIDEVSLHRENPIITKGHMERFKFPKPNPKQRCNGAPLNGWGNFGRGKTESECQKACLDQPSCKFVVFNLRTRVCTEFDHCDAPRKSGAKWSVWKKVGFAPATPVTPVTPVKMTNFQMERFPREDPPTLCYNATYGWGNLGRDMTDSECADACLRHPSCKLVGNYWFVWGKGQKSPNGGRCTQWDTCIKVPGKRFVPYFWQKVPAPAPVPLPPAREKILTGDQRRWHILPGEVKWANTTTAPDNISAGYTDTPAPTKRAETNCWWKYTMDKCLWRIAGSQKQPVEKHGDPKGVEWCAKKSNNDTKKDLCDQTKAKYDEVEQLEASISKAYIERARWNFQYEHTTMFGRGAQQKWFKKCRTANTKCGEINEKLSKALGELAALNDKVVG